MAREYEDRIQFLTSPGLDNRKSMREAVKGFGWPDSIINVVAEDDSLWQHFGIRFRGSWVFISEDGAVERGVGHIPEKDLRRALDRLA